MTAPFFDGLGGGFEAELAQRWSDADVEERARIVGVLRSVGADLVVTEHDALGGAEPDEHGIEAGARGAAQHLCAVGAVAAQAVAIAELGEHLCEPRVGGDAGILGLTRRSFGRWPQQAQQPADHPGTDRAFQISSAYSRIVRSEENFPIRATFRIAMRVQRSLSRNA